jgi:hypothetical protein
MKPQEAQHAAEWLEADARYTSKRAAHHRPSF